MVNKFKNIILFILLIVIGFIIGFYVAIDLQPRSYLSLEKCKENCWDLKELTGLMVSVGITKISELIPDVVKETDMAIAINHPNPQANIHYVIFPKKDVKDISDITENDEPYLIETIKMIGELVRESNLEDYRLITNGPGYQSIRYLHFHLLSR